MLVVDDKFLSKMSQLARLRFSESEKGAVKEKLSGIFAWVEELMEVDVSDVEPMTNVICNYNSKSYAREDVVEPCNVDSIMKNAPDEKCGFFVVPKVIE